jgi:radical SAM protein with 4Fe4S-binding SPASM domain
VGLKTAQIYNYRQGSPLIPTLDEYSRYRKDPDGSYSVKSQLLNHCWKMWHSCVITWNGAVVPCCFDKDAHYQLGDLQKDTFRQLWNGQPYRSFRQTLLQSRSQVDMCRNCTEGTQVWG